MRFRIYFRVCASLMTCIAEILGSKLHVQTSPSYPGKCEHSRRYFGRDDEPSFVTIPLQIRQFMRISMTRVERIVFDAEFFSWKQKMFSKPGARKTTTMRQAAVGETGVSWHQGVPINFTLKPLTWTSRHYGAEGVKGDSPNLGSIMSTGLSRCIFLYIFLCIFSLLFSLPVLYLR